MSSVNLETAENLPKINAKTYQLRTIRRSEIDRKVYLFELPADHPENQHPKQGQILLLKKENEPFMAFQVLKAFPEKNRIAAKRIKKYTKQVSIKEEESFLAVEKISDITPLPSQAAPLAAAPEDLDPNADPQKSPPPPSSGSTSTALDKDSSRENSNKISPELASNEKPPAYDPELDSATSPEINSAEKPEQDDQDPELGLAIDETHPFEHSIHWLSLGFGSLRVNSPPATGGTRLLNAGSFRYGITLGRRLFLSSPAIQDSLVFDVGAYLYKIIGYAIDGDSYTVLGLVGAFRYNLLFSEHFGIFFTLGAIQNRVIANSDGTNASFTDGSLKALNTAQPVLGTGMIFQIGPGWLIKADLGLDSLGANLVLKF